MRSASRSTATRRPGCSSPADSRRCPTAAPASTSRTPSSRPRSAASCVSRRLVLLRGLARGGARVLGLRGARLFGLGLRVARARVRAGARTVRRGRRRVRAVRAALAGTLELAVAALGPVVGVVEALALEVHGDGMEDALDRRLARGADGHGIVGHLLEDL